MRDRIAAFARAAGSWVPDATAAAVIMLVILASTALALGNSPVETVDAWYRGLWMLLPFSMQMALMLVLSGVLSQTAAFRRAVQALAEMPQTAGQSIALAVAVASILSYFHWAIGITMGPLIAVQFAAAAERKGIQLDFPFLLATLFAATSVWQYGLSSSAALLMATPGHFLEDRTGVWSLGTTIGSLPALAVVIAFPFALVAMARWLRPRDAKPLSAFPHAEALARDLTGDSVADTRATGFSGWTERTALFPWLLAAALGAWLFHHFVTLGSSLELNSVNAVLLMLALMMQGSIGAFSRAMGRAVLSCAPIIVLYQLYGGVAGVLQFTSVGEWFARLFAELATPLSFPLLTALGGSIIAIFVPSSGGQWVIQGFVTVAAAENVGASPQLGMLALGIGDQMGNLLAPFWVVVVAGIARIDFREIFGHVLTYALLWFAIGVGCFTLLR